MGAQLSLADWLAAGALGLALRSWEYFAEGRLGWEGGAGALAAVGVPGTLHHALWLGSVGTLCDTALGADLACIRS